MKKALTGIALLLLLITGLWFIRGPVVIVLGNLYLQPYELELNCIDFSVNHLRSIKVQKLCLTGPQIDINLEQANWNPSQQSLRIHRLNLSHRPQPDNRSASLTQPLRWEIPALPAIHIDNLHISSPLLKQPLTFSVDYRQPYLQVQGPVKLSAKLENNLLSGTLNWRLADIRTWVDLPDQMDDRFIDSPIQSTWQFDGQQLGTQHQLDMTGSVILPLKEHDKICPVKITAQGVLNLNADLITQQTRLDLSALPGRLSFNHCGLSLPQTLATWQPETLDVTVPESVTVDSKGIRIPRLKISSTAPLKAHIEFKQLYSDYTGIGANYLLQADNTQGHWQGSGSLKMDNINAFETALPLKGVSLSAEKHQFSFNQIQYDDASLKDIHGQFDLSLSPEQGLNSTLSISANTLTQAAINASGLKLDVSLTSANLKQIHANVEARLGHLNTDSVEARNLNHHSTVTYQDTTLSIEGTSDIASLLIQGVTARQLKLSHQASAPTQTAVPYAFLKQITSHHSLTLPSGFHASLDQQRQQVLVEVPNQALMLLNGLIRQRLPQFQSGSGKIDAQFTHQLDTQQTLGRVKVNNLNIAYGTYLAEGINLNMDVGRDSGGLHIPPAILRVDHVQTGADIRAIEGRLTTQSGQVVIEGLEGNLFGGMFSLDKLVIRNQPQISHLTLKELDMALILALQQESGIDIQGKVSGLIPLHIDSQGVEIRQGKLFNLTEGKLQITDNAAFAALKQNQPQLAPMLSLLQNLDFTQLNSDVSMQPDGLLYLKMHIKGRNPIEKQDVNFNYTHEENVFTLLRALRLSDELNDKLEKSLK